MRSRTKKWTAFSMLAVAAILCTASYSGDNCDPMPPAPCNPDNCGLCYCLGPENVIANAPTSPKTCNGDFFVTVSGFYWKGEQDGMEYAIHDRVVGSDGATANPGLNRLIDAEYLTPDFRWDFGFKVGVGYASPCDGWDVSVLWTYFCNRAHTHDEAEFSDNQTLLPLWSAFQFPNAGNAPILFVSDIETTWKLNLNLIDVSLGREFWVSRYLSVHPFIGLRIPFIDQDFHIQHKGGSFNDPGLSINLNDEVDLDNQFKGVGPRAGLDTNWNLSCGFSLYGNLAVSIIYGRFDVDHDEMVREATEPFTKNKILETEESFRVSRAIMDLGLGVQWATLLCDCKYGLTLRLGFEEHCFFHQNQLWRVVRNLGTNGSGLFNNTGENVYHQRRGNLTTQGWTLTGKLDF